MTPKEFQKSNWPSKLKAEQEAVEDALSRLVTSVEEAWGEAFGSVRDLLSEIGLESWRWRKFRSAASLPLKFVSLPHPQGSFSLNLRNSGHRKRIGTMGRS